MNSLIRNFAHGCRMLWKDPGGTVLAVIALGLGIGLVTTQFSVTSALMLKDLPFEKADRICRVFWYYADRQVRDESIRLDVFHEMKKQQGSFEALAAFTDLRLPAQKSLEDDSGRIFTCALISANFLGVVRVQPQLGRGFRQGEDVPGADPVVLIGYNVWQRDFQGDPKILEQTLYFKGRAYRIIGVMPKDFEFPFAHEIWAPLDMDPLQFQDGNYPWMYVFGRLKPGVSLVQASEELKTIVDRFRQQGAKVPDSLTFPVHRYTDLIGKEGKRGLLLMLGSVGFVLLIACANVSSVLLARAMQRSRELAIRFALGATRGHLLLLVLSESLVLALLGGIAGVLLALWGTEFADLYLQRLRLPFWMVVRLDAGCLLFVLAATMISGIGSGLIPAFLSSRPQIHTLLKEDPRTSSGRLMARFSQVLVGAQLTVTGVLLFSSFCALADLREIYSISLPCDSPAIMTASVNMDERTYPKNQEVASAIRRLNDILLQDPAVEKVAVTSRWKMGRSDQTHILLEGQTYPNERSYPRAYWEAVTEDYFTLFDASLLQGRGFTPADTAESIPVAIVNTMFAHQHWPGQNPLGKRFRLADGNPDRWITVVGMAPNLRMSGLDKAEQKTESGFYMPMNQYPHRWMTVLAKGKGHISPSAAVLLRSIQTLNPHQSIWEIRRLDAVIAYHRAGVVYSIGSFEMFTLVAILISALGVYGIVAFSVNRRTQEIGIRIALGARGGDILRIVARQILPPLIPAILLGFPVGYFFVILARGHPDEVKPFDPALLFALGAGACAILLATTVLACWAPARRAVRLNPMTALREE